MQSTVSELSNLGDHGGSNIDQIFWVVDEDSEDAGMDDEEDQEMLFNSMVLSETKFLYDLENVAKDTI